MKMTRAFVATTALLLGLSACGSGQEPAEAGTVTVVTSFYPLEHAATKVGGDHVSVANLTRPGAEPHDLELSPQQVLEVSRADALVYLAEFQPAVDDVATEAGDAAFDVSPAARLDLQPDDHDEAGGHEGHDHGARDPHFWLDPTRYADVVDALAEHLAEVDPEHASDYRANAEDFTDDLADLDRDLSRGLASCAEQDLVTGHSAFAYFADRYGFHQRSVSGLTPDSEPSPAALADLIAHIKKEKVSTVYAETLVPRNLADTIARDSGAEVAVLDPIEGLTKESEGSDYIEVMRSNLATVKEGQRCS